MKRDTEGANYFVWIPAECFDVRYIYYLLFSPHNVSNCNNINQGNNFSSGLRARAFLSPSSFLMSLALKECGHTQTINIINGVCLMKEELLDSTMVHCSPGYWYWCTSTNQIRSAVPLLPPLGRDLQCLLTWFILLYTLMYAL